MPKSFIGRTKKTKLGDAIPSSSKLFKTRSTENKSNDANSESSTTNPLNQNLTRSKRLSDDFDDSFDLFIQKKSSKRESPKKSLGRPASKADLHLSPKEQESSCPFCLREQSDVERHMRLCNPCMDETTLKALREVHSDYLNKRRRLGVPFNLLQNEESDKKGLGLEYFGKHSSEDCTPSSDLANKWNNKFKKNKPLLLRRTKNERENIITQKVALILMGNEVTDVREYSEFVEASSEVSSDRLKAILLKDSPLWKLSVIDLSVVNLKQFYVISLSPYVSVNYKKTTSLIEKVIYTPSEDIESNIEMFDPELHFTQKQLINTQEPFCEKDTLLSPEADTFETSENIFEQDWENFFGNSELSDMELNCQDGSFKCHSLVLLVRSKTIYKEIEIESRESGVHKYLDWSHVTLREGKYFLKFIYSGVTSHFSKLDTNELETIMELSSKYNIKHLKKLIEDLVVNTNEPKESCEELGNDCVAFDSIPSPADIFDDDAIFCSDQNFDSTSDCHLSSQADSNGGKRKSTNSPKTDGKVKKFKLISPCDDLVCEPPDQLSLSPERSGLIGVNDSSDCSTLPPPEPSIQKGDTIENESILSPDSKSGDTQPPPEPLLQNNVFDEESMHSSCNEIHQSPKKMCHNISFEDVVQISSDSDSVKTLPISEHGVEKDSREASPSQYSEKKPLLSPEVLTQLSKSENESFGKDSVGGLARKTLDFDSAENKNTSNAQFLDDSYLPSGHDVMFDYNNMSSQNFNETDNQISDTKEDNILKLPQAKNSLEKHFNDDSFSLSGSLLACLDGGDGGALEVNKSTVTPICQSTPTGLGKTNTCVTPSPQLIISDTATPLLNYSSMISPELQSELRKHGLKPNIDKGKAKMLLRYIYNQTHPVVPAPGGDQPQASRSNDQAAVTEESDNDYLVPLSNSESDEERTHLSDVYNSTEDEDDGQNIGSTTNKNGLMKSVSDFIKSDKTLYESILHYVPIWLNKFHQLLKENNISCSKSDLMDVLDELCVTFRTEKKQRIARSRKKKKQK